MSDTNLKNNQSLFFSVLGRYCLVFIVLGLLFFLTAGSILYMNGWIYIGSLLVLMGIGFIILYIKDKPLLEKRIKIKEREKEQKTFVKISAILILIMYILPGFDYRFKWSNVPAWVVIAAEIILIIGYCMFLKVMLQNSYASRIVEIQEKQKVIDTGLYSIVRHPMYSSILLIYISTPLILGSFIALIPSLIFPFLLTLRIRNEEKILIAGLDGYSDYTRKVKFRLIPYIW